MAELGEVDKAMYKKTFAMLDEDGDGVITAQDLHGSVHAVSIIFFFNYNSTPKKVFYFIYFFSVF